MTGLASDRDLVPARVESVLAGVVALGDLARMAVRAHEVPVLRTPGPVQFIAEVELLVRVLAEPALAACGFRAGVPGDCKRLQATAGQLHQVLLQRLESEGVLHFEVRELAVGSVGAHVVLAVAPEEARRHAVEAEFRVVEVAANRVSGGVLHRACMLRRSPRRGLAAAWQALHSPLPTNGARPAGGAGTGAEADGAALTPRCQASAGDQKRGERAAAMRPARREMPASSVAMPTLRPRDADLPRWASLDIVREPQVTRTTDRRSGACYDAAPRPHALSVAAKTDFQSSFMLTTRPAALPASAISESLKRADAATFGP